VQSITTALTSATERDLINRLVSMFPADEMSARAMRGERSAELFTSFVRDNETVFVLPRNIKDFTKNLLMIAILKAAQLKGYVLETSLEKDLPEKVLKVDDADFAAGYVYQASREVLGDYVNGNSKFAKGQQAYQRSCIDRHYRQARHLKKGGDSKLDERFSKMKEFTKDYWSVRTRITSLFKSLNKKTPVNLISYLLSKQELEKLIHTSLSWDNRGLFRSEEITYLNSRNSDELEALTAFRARLDSPSERLASHFEEDYARIRRDIKASEAEVAACINRRADVIFVKNAKKKRDIEYNKRKLLDKVAEFTEVGKVSAFSPHSLPGISLISTTANLIRAVADDQLWTQWRVPDDDNEAREVVTSWNSYLHHFVRQDEE